MKARVKTEKEMKKLYGKNWIQKAEKTETGWMLEMNELLGKTIEVELDEHSQTDEWFGAGWYWIKEWLVFDEESGENK